MLLSLKLENLILVTQETIAFGKGLNILTGETGAGKSIVLTAIRLITGEKASVEYIRKDAPCASIEAEFSPGSLQLPEEMDQPVPGEPIGVRREILRSGKSRCFIHNQLVPIGSFRNIIEAAMEVVGQNSSQTLCSKEAQQNMLDAFANLQEKLSELRASFNEELKIKKQLDQAIQADVNRQRDLQWAESAIQHMEEINWQPKEEEALQERHHRLLHAQKLIETTGAVAEGLSSVSPELKRLVHLLDAAIKLDPHVAPIGQVLKSSGLELEDAESSLRSYLERCDADPAELGAVEQRIAAIEQLKRRFGSTWEEIEKQKGKFKRQVEQLNLLEEQIQTLQDHWHTLQRQNMQKAQEISDLRSIAANALSKQVLEELQCLNLPHAQFEIGLTKQPISSDGIDSICFLFSANPGLAAISLDECASGGELSRLLLAIKTVLAEKENYGCIVFDEIDSNVGGQTAVILGEKLRELSKKRQVICVTHFVQVAKAAMHHFQVSKQEECGNCRTTIQKLSKEEREKEYHRMIGD